MSEIRILVVEDEITLRKIIEFRLKKDGYLVETADNGKDALEMIRQNPPDLILTDLMIPFLTGSELISYVRNEMKSQIPIIVLSAVGLEHTIIESFNLGADDFITKPFSPNELTIRVKKNLEKNKR